MKKLTSNKIVLAYAVLGCLWILFSDLLMSAISHDQRVLTALSILKGWIFVAITSLLLYWLIRRHTDSLMKKEGELRRSEERFRSIVETTGEWIWEIDLEGRHTYCNPAIEKILGYRPDEMIGKSSLAFVHEEDQKKIREMLPGMITEKTGWKNLVLRWIHRDRSVRYLESNAVPILNERGDITGFRGSDRDITDRRKAEEELIKNQKLDSLGVLAGGIAHEFNNALTAILGNISLIKMRLSHEDASLKRLEEIEKASMKASDLSQQLITFSKGGTPVKKVVALEPLIRHYAAFSLRGTGVSIEFDFAEGLWPVEIDEGQIGQVFNNLVLNACQAMPKGGKIRIRGENSIVETTEGLPLRYGYYVKLTVSDEGVGIPPEMLQKIFDPYYTIKMKGRGLGLAIAYSILRNHDGYITATSEPGVGTTFILYLPYSRREVPGKSPDSEHLISGKGRVLLMDDEEMVRSVGGAILQELGYGVDFAQDGAEAVRLYKEALSTPHPFDAVIMDLTVPGGMGGLEAVRELRNIDPEIKAIVSSGYSNDPIMADFSDYGFSGVIPKPYTSLDLSKILHRVITGKQQYS